MDDEQNARLHNQAFGQALYAATLGELLIADAAARGDRNLWVERLENALMALERGQAMVGGDPGAGEYARQRLEALIGSLRKQRPS